jgi:hypothetical protein
MKLTQTLQFSLVDVVSPRNRREAKSNLDAIEVRSGRANHARKIKLRIADHEQRSDRVKNSWEIPRKKSPNMRADHISRSNRSATN